MVSLVIEYERALKKDIFVGSRLCAKSGHFRQPKELEILIGDCKRYKFILLRV